jgi:hypothetical protein
MTLGKEGAAVQVVSLATFIAPIRLQLALAGSPKPMRLFTSCSTIWAAKSCRVKMAYQPCFTCLCIESFGDWEFPPSILTLFTLSVDELITDLSMINAYLTFTSRRAAMLLPYNSGLRMLNATSGACESE